MAADKTHLKTTLIPTDQKTDAGRIIYKNADTNEIHSELSITFEYPRGSGKWINIPSIHNGRIYSQKQIMRMLKNGDITPTSSHNNETEAIEAAIFRSNNLDHMPATSEDYVGANIDQSKVISIDTEIPVADTKIQSSSGVDIKNKAERIAAAAQSRKLTAILDRTEEEKKDHIFSLGRFWLGGAEQTLDKYGESNLKYHQKQWKKREAEAKKQEEKEKKLEERQITRNKLQWGDGADIWNSLALEREETSGLPLDQLKYPYQGQVSATDQTMFDDAKQQRRENAIGQAMSSYGPRTTPEIDTGERKSINITKPGFLNLHPEEKMKDNRSLGNATLSEYGEKPGFKFESAGYKKPDGEEAGYWSADETSPFWQTDAGYEKSIQTWGEKPGWVKPGYRPKKKELDIEAIKKWFTPSK